MGAAVFFFALAVFFVVAALLSGFGRKSDARNKRIQDVKSGGVPDKGKAFPSAKERMARLHQSRKNRSKNKKPEKKNTAKSKKDAETERELELAGLPLSARQFSILKLVIAAVLLLLVYMIGPSLGLASDILLLCCAGALALGLILPGYLLKSRIAKKRDGFRNELPDLMDLLSVSVEAGLGFDAALTRLYEKNKSALMEELMRAQLDIHHGISKKAAYASVSARCSIKELTTFLNALVQAEELGVSIRSVLKVQSEALRAERQRRAEEKALKAPVTMLIPMVIFIFPVIFIVLLGPAAMNIIEVL